MKAFLGLLTAAFLALASPATAVKLGDDGLHKQPWFTTTFRDIAEDIETATAAGKRLVLIFEQRGCIYCKRLHEEVLSDPEVAAYIQENYIMVQYNMFGDEEVIDLNGDQLTEKTAARKWRIVYTPTIMFLPEDVPQEGTAADAAVSIMPGAFGKWTSLNMFKWVVEKGYEGEEHFQKYHARKLEEARAAGQLAE
uniref:thioredoxin family protein n=1 Tax=Pararhizobium sp. IMCC3301 TaxID=3067904 RepID=UPI00274121AA|nr:thioredoxin family protein [Pararhizobium sp. IMCC3301]